MNCVRCEICGQEVMVFKLCIPVRIGTADGHADHCWCICEDCQEAFLGRSHHVLEVRQAARDTA